MKKILLLFFMFFCAFFTWAQEGFLFENKTEKIKISFQLINNLVIIPIKVNGIELNFLLDSGVEETILFSLDDTKEITFANTQKITLRGLGSQDAIEGLKSENNILEIGNLKSRNHLLYIVLNQEFNLSSHLGVPVNGIIGYSFFKNNLIKINYETRKIIVYKDNVKIQDKIAKNFTEIPISIEKFKPYLESNLEFENTTLKAKLLIDTGNTDAIWLFQNKLKNIKTPTKNFDDYLGMGFSGEVLGKRSRITSFSMANFEFKNPIIAYPDSTAIQNVKLVPNRLGSVGGEILKRFTVVFDYTNQNLFLKKNNQYNNPFAYNKSGLEIQHSGLQWIQETVHLQTSPLANKNDPEPIYVNQNFKYKFELKPIYAIASVRKNSQAALAGLQKNDIIISINKKLAYQFSLQKINDLLRSEDQDWLTFVVERDSQLLKFRFQLIDIL